MPVLMTPNEALISGLLGCLGGIARSITGLIKAKITKRRIFWKYWLVTTAIAGIVGTSMGILLGFDWRLSILAGYAGIDLIEGIYKIFKGQKIVVRTG